MQIFNQAIQFLYLIFELGKIYWLYIAIVGVIIYSIKYKNNFKKSSNFLKAKTGFIVLDGKFEAGKTRLMTELARTSQETGRFVLSNFYNGYNFIKWNSLEDLRLLLYDVWLLGEYQNFTDEELKTIYTQDGNKNLNEKFKKRREIKRRYPFIPKDGYHNSFIIEGDEFQNYMFNRGAMSNFSGENKNLLKLFHQVRHFNSLVVLATQSSDELDVKFRRLSTFYINTFEKAGGFFYGYNVYEFFTDKENNLDLERARKFTKVPVLFLNKYHINNIISNLEYTSNRLWEYEEKLNYLFKRKIFTERIIKKKFQKIEFHTKYNVNPDTDTYKEGDLFRKLNAFYKKADEEKKSKKYLTNKN